MLSNILDRNELNTELGLSCVENYFIYALKKYDKNYSLIFFNSYLSFRQIVFEFYINKAKFSSFYKIPRLQMVAKKNQIISVDYSENFEYLCNKHDYILLGVTPEFITCKYNISLWRDDHYILLNQKDKYNFYYLNDTPKDNGVLTIDEINSISRGNAIGFTFINRIDHVGKDKLLISFKESLNYKDKDVISLDFDDLQMVRDIFGVIKITYKRIKAFLNNYISTEFMNESICFLDKYYALLEYMRLRKKWDPNQVKKMVNTIDYNHKNLIESITRQI